MWQCTKCQAYQMDPKSNLEHIQKCKSLIEIPIIFGWEGILLNGIPKTKSGRYLEWNHLLDISIKKP